MKKRAVLAVLLSTATVGSTTAGLTASAVDGLIYGTMEIPYSEFYASEGIEGVDTVSSATDGKWKNENLVNGTYSVERENGGEILGVKYYVGLTEETLNRLGQNNYNFERVEEVPSAYKVVTETDGHPIFSAVEGATETAEKAVTLSTEMVWGDYVLDIDGLNNANGTSDFGTIYGVILKTENGDEYGMRHLENIWRNEIAWSSGILLSEPHGNTLSYEDYTGLMGQTVKEIEFITETGYHIIPVNIYIPIKFNNTTEVASAAVTAGTTTFTAEGFPEDYAKSYSVTGNGEFTVTDGEIAYNAVPGSYTLKISDENGKYADVKASFTLTTDKMPASFDGENKLVKAEGYTQEELDNFIKNISNVKIDETDYASSGKRGVKIVADDGSIDLEGTSKGGLPLFPEDKEYSIVVEATGYTNTLEFRLTKASVEEQSVFGTMEIPYSEFYAGEGIEGVDTVSSATSGKWKNENLVAGTYNEETENGGKILGVKYYVSVKRSVLEQLGENNYNFTEIEEVPTAYKIVEIKNGETVFSSVQGIEETVEGKTASISTDSKYGDYTVTVDAVNNGNGTSDFGTIYGIILKTADGEQYAMRHLENIWRDQIAWSSGIKTVESHGNTLSYEQYTGLMGQTITGITYITQTGYHTIPTEIYVPVKFENTVKAENADVKDGNTAFTAEGFPEDYAKSYSVRGNGTFSVSEGSIKYADVKPGSYTLVISDTKGKYADVTSDFILSTDELPVKFDGEKIVFAEGYTQEDFEAYIANIANVSIDDVAYSASGKRSVKIVKDDGTLDLEAVSGETAIFGEKKEYNVTVRSTGYNTDLVFVISTEEIAVEPSNEVSDNETSETSKENSETSNVSSEVSETSEKTAEQSNAGSTTGNSNTNTNVNNGTVNNTANNTANNTSNTNTNTNTNKSVVNTGSKSFALTAGLTALLSSLTAVFAVKRKKKEEN